MRMRVRGWLGLFAAVGTVAIAASCSGRIPAQPDQNLCDGSQVHAMQIDPDSCSRCLEDKCCDDVGDCSRNDVCKTAILKAQICVLDAGSGAGRTETEQGCLDDAGLAAGADKMYSCMKGNCGLPCGLPVCKLDPGVPSMPSASCDDCFAQTCCPELNACAKDRRCLRMVQCIITNCSNDFSRILVRSTLDAGEKFAELACAIAAGAPPVNLPQGGEAPRGPSECFDKCYDETVELAVFSPDASFDLDRARSACLVNTAFVCGAKANCGQYCQLDAGVEAGNDAGDAGNTTDAADASDAD